MKLINRLLLLAGLAAFAGALTAGATPLQVAYGPVNTQPSNNGVATLTTWATNAIATYNANNYPGAPLPALGTLQFQITPSGPANGSPPAGWPTSFPASTTTSITLPLGGFQYIILSWGGSTLPDDNGTADYLYYIGGTSGNFTFTQPDGANGGLSGISVFGTRTVPDGGATVALLGLGLVGLVAFRRRFASV
jgi:hypothetical protein